MLSVLICLLGLTLVAVPDFSVSLLCWLGGILLTAFGCIRIVGYFSRDLYRLAFQYDLAFGILMIILGLVLMLRTDAMVHILCLLLGLSVLADALLKVQIAIDARAFGIRRWWMILATAVVTGSVGLLLLLRPAAGAQVIMVLMGISFLGEGLMNLTTVWMILATAVVTGSVGLLLLLRPAAGAQVIMVLMGISFLGEGLMNLTTVLCAVQILKKQYPKIIDEV